MQQMILKRLMYSIKIRNLVQNDRCQQAFGSDGGAVVEGFVTEVVGVVAEDIAMAGGTAGILFDAQKDGNILIGMQAIGDEKRDDDDLWGWGDEIPSGDERGFFHVGVEHGGVAGTGGGDAADLVADGLGGVGIQAGAVAGDDEGGLCGIGLGSDLSGTAQDQFGHGRVGAHGLAVMKDFAADEGGWAGELEFPWDDVLGEIALADEIRHDVDLCGIDHIEGLAHRRFFFPETAMHFRKQATAADFIGMLEIRSRRVGIAGGSMTDDEQGAVGFRRDGHDGKLTGFQRIARQGRKFQFSGIGFQDENGGG